MQKVPIIDSVKQITLYPGAYDCGSGRERLNSVHAFGGGVAVSAEVDVGIANFLANAALMGVAESRSKLGGQGYKLGSDF